MYLGGAARLLKWTRRAALAAAVGGILSLNASLTFAADRPLPGVPAKAPEPVRWPPHLPSTGYVFYGEEIKQVVAGSTEADVVENLRYKLSLLGYQVKFFVSRNGDIVLVTRFERIRNATPLYGESRFNDEYTMDGMFPFWRKPIPRHLRCFVFFLGKSRIHVDAAPKSFSRHRDALGKGNASVGSEMQFGPITSDHRLTIFIYEYAAQAQEDPHFIHPSSWKPLDHLQRSGIIP
ncbi:MAG: hypothetical protein WDO17_15565 [Alphaproteobacteria bacterium]